MYLTSETENAEQPILHIFIKDKKGRSEDAIILSKQRDKSKLV